MNLEVLLVFIVLTMTIVLFVAEKIRVDVIAILIMVLVAWVGVQIAWRNPALLRAFKTSRAPGNRLVEAVAAFA